MTNKKWYAIAALLGSSAIGSPAFAQTLATTPPEPENLIDGNGVDIVSGEYHSQQKPIAVGDPANGIENDRIIYGGSYLDTLYGYANVTSSTGYPEVLVNGQTFQFTMTAGGTYTPRVKNGYTLTSINNILSLTSPDGTIYQFGGPSPVAYHYYSGLSKVIYPSGKTLTYYYRTTTPPGSTSISRIQSVVSNTGYQAKFMYQRDDTPAVADVAKWQRALMVTLFNQLADPCDVNVNMCTLSKQYPQLAIATLGHDPAVYEDADRNDTSFSVDSRGNIVGVSLPGHSVSNDITVQYGTTAIDDHYGVSSVTLKLGDVTPPQTLTTNYTYSTSGSTRTVTATTGSHVTTYRIDTDNDKITYFKDGAGNITSYYYDANNRLQQINFPELNYVKFEYDDRGNLTKTAKYPKPGSTLSPIVTSATYPSTCTNPVTCNEPTSTTDANGNVTNYTYDPVHGGVLTITKPAAAAGGVRPQVRYSYTRLNENGAASSSGIFVVSTVSTCATQTTCSGTADATITSYTYGRNLLPTTVTVSAGDGSLSAVTKYTYDDIGNVIAVDGPLAGTADTTQMAYSYGRRLIASLSADPDGSGPLKRRAQRMTYSSLEKLAKVEVGTATGISAAGLDNMSVAESNTTTYDAIGRKLTDTLSAGSTIFGVTQYSYDSLNRLDCVAIRMNSASWGSLPPSACTAQTPGAAGPDRIAKNAVYDADNRVTSVVGGFGQAYASTESTTYTANGKVATVTDGKNNTTTYSYDGFDRLIKTQYPSPTTGSRTSSATDYEQLTYDGPQSGSGNSLITGRRLRDGSSINYTFDHLNRLVSKNLPGGEPDVTYGYDLLSRPTSMTQTGNALSFTYDALGRLLTETGPEGTLTSTWDAAGRRTELQWPDGFYVIYDHDVLGEMTKVRENGATSGVGVLASYSYDDLGNRTGASYGNGTSTTWTPDAVSRLGTLKQNLAGTSYDLTRTFTYNPASQIASMTSSNNAYVWDAAANVNRNYAANGLNQYTASGSTSFGYDARGNLTTSGSDSYTYSSENLMKTGPGGTTLGYDPLLRLYQVTQGANTTRLAYDGLDMVAEYNGSNALQKRYVFGPGTDEPIVQYSGAGTTSRNWLMGDERGSVIALTDNSGNKVAINSYDEYGIPGSANSGRFQYTGQVWLPEIGMYYYKARMYSPSLGRFMQTDPIGYSDGLNWYNYLKDDPINAVDPLGQFGDPPPIVVIALPLPPIFGVSFVGGDGQFIDESQSEKAGRQRSAPPTTPRRVTIDKSCAGIPAAHDPKVLAAALTLIADAENNEQEEAFFGSENLISDGYTTGPFFTSHLHDEVTGETIRENRPGLIGSFFHGTHTPSIYVHSHQHYAPPRPISIPDQTASENLGLTVAAIDKAGNLTCSK